MVFTEPISRSRPSKRQRLKFKKMSRLILLLISGMALSSCDPAKVMILKTSGEKGSGVVLYGNAGMLPGHSLSDSSKIRLQFFSKSNAAKDTLFLNGIGGWSGKNYMMDFAGNFDSILFVSVKGTIRISDRKQIYNYLFVHRKGFARRKLILESKH